MLQVDGLICFYITLLMQAIAAKSLSSGMKSRDHIVSSDEVLSIMDWADCCLNLSIRSTGKLVFCSKRLQGYLFESTFFTLIAAL